MKSGFACGVGEGFDLAVVFITTAVEHDLGDFLFGAAAGDEFAHFGGCGDIRADSGLRAEFGFRGVDGNERLTGRVVDDLRGDVAAGEMDGEARARGSADEFLAKAGVAELAFVGGGPDYWTVLPSLRRICSPAKRTPLPL